MKPFKSKWLDWKPKSQREREIKDGLKVFEIEEGDIAWIACGTLSGEIVFIDTLGPWPDDVVH